MGKQIASIDVPDITLSSCSVDRHCAALCEMKVIPFWWYIGKSRLFGNYSIPFKGKNDNWWYRVKPGLCWAADVLAPVSPDDARPHLSKSFLGYQHVVADRGLANSTFVINAITNLPEYDASTINAKRRNAVRKGLNCCDLSSETSPDAEILDGCRKAWEDLTHRTGWKGEVGKEWFNESWKLLAACPGTSIIVGRETESGEVAGFLVTKIIGDTAYVDTIASRSDMLRTNVNDAILYVFLCNAKKLEGVTKAHYAIRSNVTMLEKFKTGLGFTPHPFPARTVFRPGIGLALKLLKRNHYNRMMGVFADE